MIDRENYFKSEAETQTVYTVLMNTRQEGTEWLIIIHFMAVKAFLSRTNFNPR